MRHAGPPFLQRHVADVGTVAHVDLGDGVTEGTAERRRSEAVDERHLGAAPDHHQGVREHRGPVGVDVGEGLQRQRHRHIRRHVEERAARAEGTVERGELRALGGHLLMEVPLDQVGVLHGRVVEVREDHALRRKLWIEVRRHGGGVVLDLEAGSFPYSARRRQDLRGNAVEILGSLTTCERREIESEPRQIRVAPFLGFVRGDRQAHELLVGSGSEITGEALARHPGETALVEGGAIRHVAPVHGRGQTAGRPALPSNLSTAGL